jgi:peptidoglycan/LPS O-acetylase OafA/YrhL
LTAFLILTGVRLASAVAGAFVAIVLLRLPRRSRFGWIARYGIALALLALSVLQIAFAFPPRAATATAVELVAAGALIAALAIYELIGSDVRRALEGTRR